MYANYGSTSPPLTNNPFLPNTGQQASSRYPDISSPPNNNGAAYATGGWGDGSMMNGGGYPQQQQQGMYQQMPMQTGFGGQQQMGYGGGMGTGSGFTSPTAQSYPSSSPFQPQSAFGQQLASVGPNVSGSSYSYLQGQPQQNNSYNPAQQQLQSNPGYVAQFDPYAALGQVLESSGNNSANNNQGSGVAQSLSTGSTISTTSSLSSGASSSYNNAGGASFGVGPRGDPHPKDYIRSHKQDVEAWDPYAWKQLLSSFEAMKNAWESRKQELTQRARQVIAQGMSYGYHAQQVQQEAAQLQHSLKEAESNFDSLAASLFQMQEVSQNYRQSGDIASKRRVREAINAALQSLPGWPQSQAY